jgi:N-acetylglucosamine-6-phosphate deacetylase
MEDRFRGRFLGAAQAFDVIVRNGVIASIEPCDQNAADIGTESSIFAPTLFDIQVNGAFGVDLQGMSVTPEDFAKITESLSSWGVSRWIPTFITASVDELEHCCRAAATALHNPHLANAIPGVHIEGPYISPDDGPRGAHPRDCVRNPNIDEFKRLLDAAEGKISYMTLAPESPGATVFISALREHGVIAALGHHNANAQQIADAVDAGATLSTHLGNGLASTINRHLNPLWPQLSEDRLTASLIADLQHLPKHVLKAFVRAKRPEKVILTSDCLHIAGLSPGKYKMRNADVEMLPSGRICLSGTDLLAGSSLMLLQGVANAAAYTDMTIEQAFSSASNIPAELFGLSKASYPPKLGDKADFILSDFEKGNSGDICAKPLVTFIRGEKKKPQPTTL